jgi:hypothetical protein
MTQAPYLRWFVQEVQAPRPSSVGSLSVSGGGGRGGGGGGGGAAGVGVPLGLDPQQPDHHRLVVLRSELVLLALRPGAEWGRCEKEGIRD